LNHSIYGLKQSARIWNQKVNQVLQDEGFTRSQADAGLYTRKEKNGEWSYILLYVDDLIVSSKDMEIIKTLQSRMNNHFETKDLGNASYYLGIQIERKDDGSFRLHQTNKISQMLQDFGMQDAK